MSDETVLETRFLHQPRGPGKAWAFRMATPEPLVGRLNPKTGKPFGKVVHEGLGTRDLREARRRRDIRLGELRVLERHPREKLPALPNREIYMQVKREAEAAADPERIEAEEDGLQQEAEAQYPRDKEAAARWYKVVTGQITPLKLAYEKYVAEKGRSLSRSSLNNLRTAYTEFLAFAGQDITLEDCDRRLIGRFVSEYLPNLRGPKAPNGQGPATIKKKVSQLAQIWKWAMARGLIPFAALTPWDKQGPSTTDVRKAATRRQEFRPGEVVALLKAAPAGTALGDILRIALLTGARLEEIASLDASQVADGCTGYTIREGKSANAARYVPLVRDAQKAVKRRRAKVGASGPIFPELKVRRSTGKRGGTLSQQFTRLRREVLGVTSDGKLAQHSLRHTWRTAARRAGVDERTAKELGGWSRGGHTDSPYDHGLEEDHYRRDQQKVVRWLITKGYLGSTKEERALLSRIGGHHGG